MTTLALVLTGVGIFALTVCWVGFGIRFADRFDLSNPDTLKKCVLLGILGGPIAFVMAIIFWLSETSPLVGEKIKSFYES